MVDKTIDEQPLLIAPTGADVAASKTNTDYRIRVGEANGIAVLDSSAKLPNINLPTHTHPISDVVNLQTTLDAKQPLDADLTAIAALAGASGLLRKTALNTWTLDTATYLTGNQTITLSGDVSGSGTTTIVVTVADDSHSHTISTVTGLQAALDGKQPVGSYAAASHTHTTSQITDLSSYIGFDARYYTETEVNTLLSGKANTSHTHVATDISDSSVTGRAVLTAVDQDAARDAIGVYVQATDPGAVPDGSLWIW